MTDVLVLAGSQSDAGTMFIVLKTLDEFGVSHHSAISSAHRTPERTTTLAKGAETKGYKAIIGIAGWAAALPGDISAHCLVLPVYGVAVANSNPRLEEAAVLSMTCLPPGTPVAFCGVGEAGAICAALESAKAVGLTNPEVRQRVREWREAKSESVKLEPDFSKVEKK